MKNKITFSRSLLLIFIAISLVSCNNFQGSLFGPSGIKRSGDLIAWQPCVIVQNPGFRGTPPFEIQFREIDKLQRAGKLVWIRLGGLSLRGDGYDYLEEAKARGFKVFAIISLDDLNSRSSWEDAFDEIYRIYPGVDIWEIAGEISNPAINPETINPDQFMVRFKTLYSHIKNNYPRTQIASPPTLGSAATKQNPVGPFEFQRFIELGLLDMDVIIAINVYTPDALRQYSAIFDRYASKLSHKRVWVTETSSGQQNTQIDWVNSFYPNLSNTIRPEMICWYALWTGDIGGDNPAGLISGIEFGEFEERELFKALTRGVE